MAAMLRIQLEDVLNSALMESLIMLIMLQTDVLANAYKLIVHMEIIQPENASINALILLSLTQIT